MKQQTAAVAIGMVLGIQIIAVPFIIGVMVKMNDVFGMVPDDVWSLVCICAVSQWILCIILACLCADADDPILRHEMRMDRRKENIYDMKEAGQHLINQLKGERT